ncbi:hypothetical protein PHYBLDRAFT_72073 [Phycomyces blakesleeanus NRRL 1555(-)]|uniref:Uncharacterized protein n=1 Tax=Phycomyces blakesleeanus (strain ATCC 8743b / DSM 1359 / FGSC 10004 / NBRC 33097 / NRRL 1555) TaxID=763407 RepID=A0A167M0X2_PHYB8|nr:hypothetical protein PHYBLDRAFT_72073 [Phycomyces blakesleeanus NRRL 1555(-)]OAD71486.1 hypothetical protein PHYBLDRAFT_72073 [Phycomyces blakesleeanus NRRL 1555(-)]|eukprot:XP_018289526.1 hypothetical protein PHYBLDRAFT_72073 [Phycomyces blakesleeanus NRRL 1555(-)]
MLQEIEDVLEVQYSRKINIIQNMFTFSIGLLEMSGSSGGDFGKATLEDWEMVHSMFESRNMSKSQKILSFKPIRLTFLRIDIRFANDSLLLTQSILDKIGFWQHSFDLFIPGQRK